MIVCIFLSLFNINLTQVSQMIFLFTSLALRRLTKSGDTCTLIHKNKIDFVMSAFFIAISRAVSQADQRDLSS